MPPKRYTHNPYAARRKDPQAAIAVPPPLHQDPAQDSLDDDVDVNAPVLDAASRAGVLRDIVVSLPTHLTTTMLQSLQGLIVASKSMARALQDCTVLPLHLHELGYNLMYAQAAFHTITAWRGF